MAEPGGSDETSLEDRTDPDGRDARVDSIVDSVLDDPEDVRNRLFEWYDEHHREFPWRDTNDPYAILVCEVMSQQTQLDRILEPWRAFLDRWPTVTALAESDRSEVVAFWSEHRLGYNNRARYLHEAAGQILERFDGSFPETPAELETLQGVGPYTANAVASFAFGRGRSVVDTNVKRVLYRAFDVPDDDEAFERIANELAPTSRIGAWNNAVMELGALACRKTPRCDDAACPLREWCLAYEVSDFTAPDVPTQPPFEGSRRYFRGRVIASLRRDERLTVDELGHRIRVDFTPDGEHGRSWLLDLLADLEADGLVTVEKGDVVHVRLRR